MSPALAAGLALLLWSSISLAAPADSFRVTRPESQLLLVAVRVDRTLFDEALPVYTRGDSTWIPLGALCRFLDLAIEVDPERGQAQGFILSEKRRFALDIPPGTITVENRRHGFDRSRIELHDDDIYVESRLLGTWLPLDLAIDARSAILQVKPREPLPLQERLARQQMAAAMLGGAPEPRAEGPSVRAPYRLWSWPASDHRLHVNHRSGAPAGGTTATYSGFGTGDLLYLETQGYLAADLERGLSDLRITSGRRDPDPVLLGPLGAREFAGGSVSHPGLDLVAYSRYGNGALVSSFPIDLPAEYERRTLRGDLPAGWEVELYQNGALTGYQQVGSNGLYEFKDIPLRYGHNELRLQFYGPEGQTLTRTEHANVGVGLAPAGEVYYRAMVHQTPEHRTRGIAEVSSALAPRLTAIAYLSALELVDGPRAFGGGGLRLGRERFFVKSDFSVSGPVPGQDPALRPPYGSAGQVAVAAWLGPLDGWAQYARLHRYRSEVFEPLFGDILDRTTLRLHGDLDPWGDSRVPTSLEWRRDGLVAGGEVHQISHQLATGVLGLNFSNRLQWQLPRIPGSNLPDDRRGFLFLSRNTRWISIRGGAEYELERHGRLQDLSLSAETWRLRGALFSAGIRRSNRTRQTTGHLSLARTHGRLGFTLRSDLEPGGHGSMSALLSLALNRDPRTGRWYAQERPVTGAGAASASVFLDQNGNGRKDAGEEPLAGITLRADPANAAVTTGTDGVAFLSGLPSGQRTDVSVVTASLEDPLWVPKRRALAVLPRPGQAVLVDFPVNVTGEIAGTAYLLQDGALRPLAGVELELVDAAGQVVKRARSAYDGFFDLSAVPPGRYILRAVSGSAAPALRGSRPVEIQPGGAILDGFDLTLERASQP
jgi:hypothetical protein